LRRHNRSAVHVSSRVARRQDLIGASLTSQATALVLSHLLSAWTRWLGPKGLVINGAARQKSRHLVRSVALW
jgi:hypothetical protein